LGWGHEAFARSWNVALEGQATQFIFIEYDKYFHRGEVYAGPWGEHQDNSERFTFLSRASLDYCNKVGWVPDVVHLHDWPCGLVPVYLNTRDKDTPLGAAASVFTIHNLQHQGIFGKEVIDFAGLPYDVFRPDGLEALGNVNMMKGGIYHATKITAVSPTYAQEIQTPEHGCGLNHVLRFRSADLVGVLNGIDTDVWNPSKDALLPHNYTSRDFSGKALCKQALQKSVGLAEDAHVAVFGVVARLYWQKGLDLLAAIIPRLLHDMHIQLVILGTGDQHLEHRLLELSYHFPGRLAVYIGYDNTLAHLIEAGADFFVMPSRFEPCGLNQMYSMTYGTPPVARATGGLVDSVIQYNEHSKTGTGFLFDHATEDALYYAMGWACSTYYDRPGDCLLLRVNGMDQDFSWTNSALTYENVYRWAIDARRV
jgi:starch synthase